MLTRDTALLLRCYHWWKLESDIQSAVHDLFILEERLRSGEVWWDRIENPVMFSNLVGDSFVLRISEKHYGHVICLILGLWPPVLIFEWVGRSGRQLFR